MVREPASDFVREASGSIQPCPCRLVIPAAVPGTALPTCPFYETGMPTSLPISCCHLALLPTETSLVDEAESAPILA